MTKSQQQIKMLVESGIMSEILKGFIDYAFTDGDKYLTKFQLRVQSEMFQRDSLESINKIINSNQ